MSQWFRSLVQAKTFLGLALVSLLLLTRFHHFGDHLNLPDASWAVFFLGGIWLQNWRYFLMLCALAAGIDASALSNGTSGFCVTPAYGFLLPSYAALWLAGQRSLGAHNIRTLFNCVVACLITFGISSFSFYFFSGYFSQMSILAYASNSLQYLLNYEVITIVYSGIALALYQLVRWNQKQVSNDSLVN